MPLDRLLLLSVERGGGRRLWELGVEGIKLGHRPGFPGQVSGPSKGVLSGPLAQVSLLPRT